MNSLRLLIALVPIVSGLHNPVQVVWSHDHTGRFYIAQQNGLVLTDEQEVFLDLRPIVSCCDNGGLLSIAFHPQYASNGTLFAQYVNRDGDTVVARYSRSAADPTVADRASGEILLVAAQPKDNVPNHHGGTLQFGPDGFLYSSIGDGGAYVKVTNRAQETTHLLGKLLRINVDQGAPYSIPGDNPFVAVAGARGEIWSIGLRNPWRFSFDRETGDLFIGDVGQDSREEIDISTIGQARGANYGWPVMEGSHCYPPAETTCVTTGMTLPLIEYTHDEGCSVTGGYRYRGTKSANLHGMYVYGDLCSGRIWGALPQASGSWSTTELLHTNALLVSFGEDDGELYVVDLHGTVLRMIDAPAARRRATAH